MAISLPRKWVICGVCDGNGAHSRHLGAFTQDEMNELGDDFRKEYMAGNYDKKCERCSGTGKLHVVDHDRARAMARKNPVIKRALNDHISDLEDEREAMTEQRNLARMAGEY